MNRQMLVEEAKRLFQPGVRVELDADLNDDFSNLKRGDRGTVRCVDDVGTIHVDWDCGSGLGLIFMEDYFHIVP